MITIWSLFFANHPEAGALLPEPHHHPTPSPKHTNGKKRRVISETIVSPIQISDTECVFPPAKRLQTKPTSSTYMVHVLTDDEENTSDLEIVSSSIVSSVKIKQSKPLSSITSVQSNSKSAKKESISAHIQKHHTLNNSTPRSSKPSGSTHTARPVSTVLTGCPLTSGDIICTRCRLKDNDKGLVLLCHCGHKEIKLPGGRAQNAAVHWESST